MPSPSRASLRNVSWASWHVRRSRAADLLRHGVLIPHRARFVLISTDPWHLRLPIRQSAFRDASCSSLFVSGKIYRARRARCRITLYIRITSHDESLDKPHLSFQADSCAACIVHCHSRGAFSVSPAKS